MVELILLAIGVCCALLCHWMIRHTYEDWTWEKFDKPDNEGRRRKKVWNKKLSLPRYVYILLWFICIVLAPIAIILPIVVANVIRTTVSDGDWYFKCENRVWKWMVGIRNWLSKEV